MLHYVITYVTQKIGIELNKIIKIYSINRTLLIEQNLVKSCTGFINN